MSRSLPARPSLEQLKKQAKDLLSAHKRKDPGACDTLRLLHRFAKATDEDILHATVVLAEAQFALALDYGLSSWKDLKAHVEALQPEAARGPSTIPASMREVVVHVTDANGRKVSGAVVGAMTWSDAKVDDATTIDGVAILHVPEGAKAKAVAALKPGVGFDYWIPTDNSGGASIWMSAFPPKVHLVLDGAKTIFIRVEGSDGKPIAGAPVAPWFIQKQGKKDDINISGWKARVAVTDAQGVAKFDWIPKTHEGGTPFVVHGGYVGRPHRVLDGNDPDGTEIIIKAQQLTRVSGKVTFPDGSPAPNILVKIHGGFATGGNYDGEARTGQDGSYSDDVYPERSYLVAVMDDEWAAESRIDIAVEEGKPVDDIDLTLIKGTIIKGRLTLGEKREPMVGETIGLVQLGPRNPNSHIGPYYADILVRGARTDEAGRYSFRVGPGRYRLGEPSDKHELEMIVRDEPEIVQDFHLARTPRGMLGGAVLEKDSGRPVGGASVRGVSSESGHAGVDAQCDDKGRFSQERWNDRMMIWAHSPDGTMAGHAEIGEADTFVRVELVPSIVAEAKVVDKDGNGFPGQGAIYWMMVDYPGGPQARFQVRTATDTSSILRMPGLIPGTKCQCGVERAFEAISDLIEFTAQDEGDRKMALPDIVADQKSV